MSRSPRAGLLGVDAIGRHLSDGQSQGTSALACQSPLEPRHFSDHRPFTKRENRPHKFRESAAPQGWIDRKVRWKIRGSGCAWVFGLGDLVERRNSGLKTSAQQEWAGIAIGDTIRPDAVYQKLGG